MLHRYYGFVQGNDRCCMTQFATAWRGTARHGTARDGMGGERLAGPAGLGQDTGMGCKRRGQHRTGEERATKDQKAVPFFIIFRLFPFVITSSLHAHSASPECVEFRRLDANIICLVSRPRRSFFCKAWHNARALQINCKTYVSPRLAPGGVSAAVVLGRTIPKSWNAQHVLTQNSLSCDFIARRLALKE